MYGYVMSVPVASKWKVYWLAPAAAISSTHCSGRDTIMWISKNVSGSCFLRAFTMVAPNVMFGTKCLCAVGVCTFVCGYTHMFRCVVAWVFVGVWWPGCL